MATTCSRCGTTSDDDAGGEGLPLGWSLATSARGMDKVCLECTRAHARDIEAKLDEEWWA